MLGEQFMVGDEVCGAVISIRFQVKCNMLIMVKIQINPGHVLCPQIYQKRACHLYFIVYFLFSISFFFPGMR